VMSIPQERSMTTYSRVSCHAAKHAIFLHAPEFAILGAWPVYPLHPESSE